ncbi:MAG: hypothetical protein DRJ37_03940 [Thermoprotei archaeon]|nr:MAG: hypothetical protein DRJ37_03940 [Thermoprotei archaeon]
METHHREKDGNSSSSGEKWRKRGFPLSRWWFGWNDWLEAIAVKREYRGRGIGAELIRTLIEKAGKIGYTKYALLSNKKRL